MDAAGTKQTYRFGEFELDLGAHQLRKGDQVVRLERRPMELLVLLVTRSGRLVAREEIVEQLWPAKVVIDFDTGLNTLVRKVRHALGDSADNPEFIETVAGLGYRFIAPVTDSRAERRRDRTGRHSVAALLLLVIAAAIAFLMWRGGANDAARTSIVVLPFQNLTDVEELNYLAAGLAEDTSASLSHVGMNDLRMIGLVSAQAAASAGMSTAQIGDELGADFIVASSLRAEGSKIRVTPRLVRVEDSALVWTASFDRELTSVLGLQRELSIAIAEQVRLRLSPEITTALERRQTSNPEAYDLYLQGRYQWSLLTAASSRRALELYEGAIAIDSEYALAWAGIAQVLTTAPIVADVDPSFVFARARHAVHRAAQLGADLSEVQYALGHFYYILDWNWPAAENALRKAVAVDANNALAYLFLGHVLSQSGQAAEAQAMVRRARELDPLFSHTFGLSSQVAFQARDYVSATEFARQALAINPAGWVGYVQLGQALAEQGEFEAAISAYDSAALFSNNNSKAIAYRAHVLTEVDRNEEAREIAVAMEADAHDRYVSPYTIALIYAGLGDNVAVFEWLERALAVRDIHLVFLPVDARWDVLRDDPRFQQILGRSRFCGKLSALVGGHCEPVERTDVADESVSISERFETRTVTSANIDGIWTATANTIAGDGMVSGLVTFTGPADKTRAMGACLVRQFESATGGAPCDTVDDCNSAPAEIPSGSNRYCVPSNNSGRNYCHYRPGPRSDYCVGSPALNYASIEPGNYRIDIAASPESKWRALACFNACANSPPAISEIAIVQ